MCCSKPSLDIQWYTGRSFCPNSLDRKFPAWSLWLCGVSPFSSALLYQHQEGLHLLCKGTSSVDMMWRRTTYISFFMQSIEAWLFRIAPL
jgi:hypothetical protein